MEVYKAPEKYTKDSKFTIFLGGSIEMDTAEKWQEKMCDKLSRFDVKILNPRRDNFDKSQEQSVRNPYFKEQVEWELDGLEDSDLIVVYLQPGTYSPISLLEIGLFIDIRNIYKHIVICCPDGFYRKGNIEVIVDRYNFSSTLLDTYEDLEKWIINYLREKGISEK